jgi:hypothetical protein
MEVDAKGLLIKACLGCLVRCPGKPGGPLRIEISSVGENDGKAIQVFAINPPKGIAGILRPGYRLDRRSDYFLG